MFSKIREAFGGNAKLFISGGAPLGKETTDWFLSVGIRVFEGYGMTETSPVISRNTFAAYRPYTVGTVIPNLETRLAEDGELEVRGTSVFAGYWKNEEATKKEFTPDGWFKTGDIAKLEDGFLSITDRKKELMKTSGGKYIAPQPLESRLKVDALVGQAALIGDQKKFVSVLISPNFDALEKWAKQNGVADGRPREAGGGCEGAAGVQGHRGQGESRAWRTMRRSRRLRWWRKSGRRRSGELTPSMKLKRRVINEKYKDRINALYGAGTASSAMASRAKLSSWLVVAAMSRAAQWRRRSRPDGTGADDALRAAGLHGRSEGSGEVRRAGSRARRAEGRAR